MTRASVAAAVIPLILAACAPQSAPDVQASPPKEDEVPVVSASKPSAQAGLWLEIEGRVKRVATVDPGGEMVMAVPELRHSVPSFRRLGARLEARALIIEGQPDIALRIDEEGFIRTTPDGLFGKDTLRVVGSELVSGEERFRLDDGGAVSPPILEAANLWLRGAEGLSAEQRWLVVVAELTFVRGGEMMFYVLGAPGHG